ncbi:FxSxx-COOH cyclophane-containing RiPP peptide [Streptomyces sp. NPDC050504]|uniref:FxSxx-COOH cyclophane-containing RiPP peptide n=1 Tax=Streptomyces sp. NPDC050504 TaxID=3365618 RepID=UPI00378DFE80
MNTTETSVSFAVAKKTRVPLGEIDVRGAEAARKLGRVLPASFGARTKVSTFNSAL